MPFIDRDDVLIDAADSGIGYKHVDVDGVVDGMYLWFVYPNGIVTVAKAYNLTIQKVAQH